jgi:TPR repeat protein
MSIVSTASTFGLEKEEIIKLEKEAESGNKDSAFRLYQYYTFSSYDKEKELYWLTVAAELGSGTAQYNLAYELFYEQKKYDEAAKWAKKAIENGHDDASEFMDKGATGRY